MVRSPDGETNFVNIVARVLQRDTYYHHVFIICLDFVIRTSIELIKEYGFIFKKKGKK